MVIELSFENCPPNTWRGLENCVLLQACEVIFVKQEDVIVHDFNNKEILQHGNILLIFARDDLDHVSCAINTSAQTFFSYRPGQSSSFFCSLY